jgi:hypothetical protein
VRPPAGLVLHVHTRTQLSQAVESDLALAGFQVLTVTDPRTLLEAANGHELAAAIVPELMPGRIWRRWNRDPRGGRVPVVVVTARRDPIPILTTALVRGDATVSATDLKRPGAAADAVRTAMARGRVTPTPRERFGEKLWNTAAVVKVVGFLVVIPGLAMLIGGGSPVAMRGLALMMSAVALLTAADILGDVGASEAQGRRLRPLRMTWRVVVLCIATYAAVHVLAQR